MEVDWGRVLGAFFGFLLSIPAVFLNLTVRFIRLGCGIFEVKQRTFPPKCLSDPELGSHKYVNVNGVKLHYVEAGQPDGPLLLMVHGFPQFWYTWRNQIRHFKVSRELFMMTITLSGDPPGCGHGYERL